MVGLGTLAERLTAVGTGRVSYKGGGGGGGVNLGNPPQWPVFPPKKSCQQY